MWPEADRKRTDISSAGSSHTINTTCDRVGERQNIAQVGSAKALGGALFGEETWIGPLASHHHLAAKTQPCFSTILQSQATMALGSRALGLTARWIVVGTLEEQLCFKAQGALLNWLLEILQMLALPALRRHAHGVPVHFEGDYELHMSFSYTRSWTKVPSWILEAGFLEVGQKEVGKGWTRRG